MSVTDADHDDDEVGDEGERTMGLMTMTKTKMMVTVIYTLAPPSARSCPGTPGRGPRLKGGVATRDIQPSAGLI